MAHNASTVLSDAVILPALQDSSLTQRIFAANDSNQKEDDGNDKQDVDKPAYGIDTDHPQEPQYEQYNGNGKHIAM